MATPAERAQVYFANALLPAPLPTPPKSKMLPLLSTPLCVAIVVLPNPNPNSSPPKKPSRADTDERWGARKDAGSNPPSKPGRADTVARWDAHKTKPSATAASASSSSSGSARSGSPAGRASSSAERWDSNKKTRATSSLASSGSPTTSRPPSSQGWDSSKRGHAVCSRASSAERSDAHKKPRPPRAADVPDDDGASSTASNDVELGKPRPKLLPRALYSGPGFTAAPEPRMLPMPSSLMVRAA